MSTRVILPLVAVAALLAGGGGGCYQDDTTASPTANGKPLAKVLLTDAPFPYDSVASVNIYVVSISASTSPDTAGGTDWVTITQPNRVFDLLALQQGTTALLGEGELSGGLYRAVRLVIDADRSSVRWNSGTNALVSWPWPGSGLITMYALVEEPLAVFTDASQVEIVIDWDLGRSFLYNYFGDSSFTVLPWLRAVHSAFTGAIDGTVTSNYSGQSSPIKNANVTVYAGDPAQTPDAWYVVASGRTDAAGYYKAAFVSSGTYIVRIEQPDYPFLDPVVTPNVAVSIGATTHLSVSLPDAGTTAGGAYVRISGPNSVGVGGTIGLRAAVGDAQGNPVPSPSVSWTSSDPAVATVSGVGDTASVAGRQQGSATITATSGGLSDTLRITVVGEPTPVATVTVVPGSASLSVGDSVGFRADLRDAGGTLLYDRPISWSASDTTIIRVDAFGSSALVRPRRAGSVVLTATSEGKSGQATITVH